MSKQDRGGRRRVSPRMVAKAGVIAAIFVAGLIVGGGCSGSGGGGVSRGDIVACLPLMDAAALDRCVAP